MKFPVSEFWMDCEQFGKDLVAGVIVEIVALPLAIGFGITSGMSAQAGMSTAILAGFIAAILIALLAAIESLLAARVADGLSHATVKFNANKELFGQGLTTMVSSIFGGQPATGAIARTSVNIRSGGKTKMAALIHAAFLLVIVLVLSPVLALIPLPAIAGVLIGTSVRILNPHNIRE
jgi:SulP family sulfate permease